MTRFRLLPILVLAAALAAPVAPASARHWHDGDYDHHRWNNDNSDQSDNQEQDQGWNNNEDWSEPQGWNPNQGDAPETPQDWTGWQPPQVQNEPRWQPDSPQRGGNGRGDNNWWQQAQQLPRVKATTVGGKAAKLRFNGKAAIPRGAPARVRSIIRAANAIVGKPYKWGGGHGRLVDSGYDCSGSVSYALIRAGRLSYPMVSGTFARWARSGKGKYMTIYANRGHVYMEVAGLRLDTSAVGDYRGKSGVRWRPVIGKRVGFAVRHLAGL